MLKSLAGKVLAAKVLAVTASAVAVGGVAYAASTGNLPTPLQHSTHAAPAAHTHKPTAAPAHPSTAGHKATRSAGFARTPKESRPTRGASPTAQHHSASPAPSLVGLCHSWLARPHEHGKADENAAFSYLIHTVGDKNSVSSWCTNLLATQQHPAQHNKSSDNPGNGNGRSSAHPTSRPHPTGKPTKAPGKPNSPGNPGSSHNQH